MKYIKKIYEYNSIADMCVDLFDWSDGHDTRFETNYNQFYFYKKDVIYNDRVIRIPNIEQIGDVDFYIGSNNKRCRKSDEVDIDEDDMIICNMAISSCIKLLVDLGYSYGDILLYNERNSNGVRLHISILVGNKKNVEYATSRFCI